MMSQREAEVWSLVSKTRDAGLGAGTKREAVKADYDDLQTLLWAKNRK